ncbi:class I adenylate-forming enzyme family protein [Paucibacter sp. R3-3]|uniref:Class I adenylate-forming enzyme family protein n=1 Tax=Roseateles agri TaxID=3098619 RepID=A0ABU5DQR9_9BURK|nr:class I adenylate-forming enzyme family protein [Paucibacter sp. R3-3]MDY0748051.1 class I adenylate-forming enzyme family protein [Paucibacter sp. R3-3]
MNPITTETHWQRQLKVYSQREPDLDQMFRASVERSPQATALVDGMLRVSYQELDERVLRLACAFHAHGVSSGDRVVVLLANRLEFVVTVLACVRVGALVVPAGTRLRSPEIHHICSDAGACAIVHEASLAPELPDRAELSNLKLRVSVAGDATGSIAFEKFMSKDQALDFAFEARAGEDDPFGILYTSGTTGRPKGAVLTHLGAIHSALHWKQLHGLKAQEVSLLAIPASHVAGLCGVVFPMLMVGACIVLMREFRARAFLEMAEREQITHALLVPAMYALCLLEPEMPRFDLARWRLGVYGSAPMPESTITRVAELLPGLDLCNAYGATETTSPATIMPLGEGISHTDSIGRVVPCGDIRVMNEQGHEVAPGETGELWIGGPMVVPGYWNNPQATASSFIDGYWKSGDIGAIDAEGFVRIFDRKKDMINRGGFKVYPAEVENALCSAPGVVEAAVVGRPDPVLTERVVAFVRRSDPALDDAALKRFCKDNMADYKVPDRIVVQDEPLPRNANGKIQKDQLRHLASEDV